MQTGTQVAKIRFGRYAAVLNGADVAWTGHKSPKDIFFPGDIVYVKVLTLSPDGTAKVLLEQDPGPQAAVLAIDNGTGDIKAMVGGRDFDESKFNRATQAQRQAGSAFKPYVYAAAVDKGAQPEDTITDEPTTFNSSGTVYTPHNFDNKFEGTITLRRALADSRNIPAVKLAQEVGMPTVLDYARRFGITSSIPPYLPVALGAADLTLFEQTSAYSVFPNDGVRMEPRYIRKVTDYEGHVLEENFPEAKDVIGAATTRTMVSLLQGVVLHGTGRPALKLNHPVAGKTGTTNDFTDAWFIGFSPSMTCGVWVGFDEKKALGPGETGGVAALPIWIDFMRVALADPERKTEAFLPWNQPLKKSKAQQPIPRAVAEAR
jgi:penicillin-binding protein 1A